LQVVLIVWRYWRRVLLLTLVDSMLVAVVGLVVAGVMVAVVIRVIRAVRR